VAVQSALAHVGIAAVVKSSVDVVGVTDVVDVAAAAAAAAEAVRDHAYRVWFPERFRS